MRAMSLAIDEGESEQNEMRSLQEKLESTTRLVFTLSQQLSELKEQVRLANQTSLLCVLRRATCPTIFKRLLN